MKLRCYLCTFSEPTDISKYCAHLKTHLRNKKSVQCPFVDCSFKSSVLSTFTAHRSPYRRSSSVDHLRRDLFVNPPLTNAIQEELIFDTGTIPSYDSELGAESEAESDFDNGETIKRQLASLFLRMQTILHVSNSAVQEVIDELFDIGDFAYTKY